QRCRVEETGLKPPASRYDLPEGQQKSGDHAGMDLRLIPTASISEVLGTMRYVEGAEHPVPEREIAAHVAIPVLGRDAVVDLVLRRADEDMLQRRPPGDPKMRMVQLIAEHREECSGDVHAEDRDE